MANIVTTLSTPDMKRLATAIGEVLGLVDEDEEPRDANPAEVKKHVGQFVTELVGRVERGKAAKNAQEEIEDIEPT